MAHVTLSDKYGIAAALGLLIILVTNSAAVMLVLSVIGLVGGFWVLRQGEVRRVAYVSFAAFAITAAFAVYGLVQGS
jgi:uncharacterized membrane protein YozB (DUF420 family)